MTGLLNEIEQVYERYKHWNHLLSDPEWLLSDPEWLPPGIVGTMLHECWAAIKAEVKKQEDNANAMTERTFEDILHDALAAFGYDGLCNPDIECGCTLDDFMPCRAADMINCKPGHKRKHPETGYDRMFPGKKGA